MNRDRTTSSNMLSLKPATNLKSSNPLIFRHKGKVEKEHREQLFSQKAQTLWLTGLSAAGKSTLAFGLESILHQYGKACYVLDGDNVRDGLNKDLGFTDKERTENIRRVAEVARLMNDAGLIVITSFISPLRKDRELARDIIGASEFFEIYVSTSLAACEQRDPKGLYRMARDGKIQDFTGISAPYEPPIRPDLVIDTELCSIESAIDELMILLSSGSKPSLQQ